jgi:hypothetical protein
VAIRDLLVDTIRHRYADRSVELVEGGERGPVARFPAAHPDVGDLHVDTGAFGVDVHIDDILHDSFHSYDAHLDDGERNQRLLSEVLRFLDELFADRLLFWKAAEGPGIGWRERGVTGSFDPLVMDDRVYRVYLWSRPRGPRPAGPGILGRGGGVSEREYEILVLQMRRQGPDAMDAETRARITQLLNEFEMRGE